MSLLTPPSPLCYAAEVCAIAEGDSIILVTGSTGFVGREIVRSLCMANLPVRAMVRTPSHAHAIAGLGAEVAYADVRNPVTLRLAMETVQSVVHLVAVIRENHPSTFQNINIDGTANVLNAAKDAGVSHFVHMSAIGAADDPRFLYLRSKWHGEQAVIRSGIPFTILRPSIQFGEGDEFFNSLAAEVKIFHLVPVPGPGKARFQPIATRDVASCVVRTLQRQDLQNQILEIGGPEHLNHDELLDIVANTLGATRLKVHIPLALMRPLMRLVNALAPHPPATPAMLDMLTIDNITELNAVPQTFGFTPMPVACNINYIRRLTITDAFKIAIGFMPHHIRDH